MKFISGGSLALFVELRARLIRSLLFLLIVFSLFSYEANALYETLAKPLLKQLPSQHFIATAVTAPFFIPFKLAFLCAVLVSAPVFLYQLGVFASPALYQRERRFIWKIMTASVFLFYAGTAFAYFIILPLLFQFLAKITPAGVMFMPDMSDYLDFTMQLLLAFGVLFEIPIVMLVLAMFGCVNAVTFKKMRPYAIVGAFVLGMLFAPPDVLSQTCLALPIWGLYEVGLLLTRALYEKKK